MRYEFSDVQRLINADETGWLESVAARNPDDFFLIPVPNQTTLGRREVEEARKVLAFAVRADSVLKDKGFGNISVKAIKEQARDLGLQLELLPGDLNYSGTLCRLTFGVERGMFYPAYLKYVVGIRRGEQEFEPFWGEPRTALVECKRLSVSFTSNESTFDLGINGKITLCVNGEIKSKAITVDGDIEIAKCEILRALVDALATGHVGLVKHQVTNGRIETAPAGELNALWIAAFTNDGFAFHRECEWCGKVFHTNNSRSRCCCPEHSARLRTYKSNGRGRRVFTRSGSGIVEGGEE